MAKADIAPTKVCCKCGVEKPRSEFKPRPDRGPESLMSRCIPCARETGRERYAENAEYQRARVAKYREENRNVCNERTKRWRENNPEKRSAYAEAHRSERRVYEAAYQAGNRERISARKAAYYAANPEKQTERSRKDRERHGDRIIATRQRWREENPGKEREYTAAWRAKNPEARAAQIHNRRARKLSAPGSHTKQETLDLLERQTHCCANPHCRADLRTVRKALDHKVALANGGSNSIDNLQWLCMPCNSRKSTLDEQTWLAREALRAAA